MLSFGPIWALELVWWKQNQKAHSTFLHDCTLFVCFPNVLERMGVSQESIFVRGLDPWHCDSLCYPASDTVRSFNNSFLLIASDGSRIDFRQWGGREGARHVCLRPRPPLIPFCYILHLTRYTSTRIQIEVSWRTKTVHSGLLFSR